MDPISNQQFSHDYTKFVYQDPDVKIIHKEPPRKPFEVKPTEKSKKSKKDNQKNDK